MFNEDDDFPYKKHFLPTAQEMMANLKSTKFHINKTKIDPILVRVYPDDYIKSDEISNLFTEPARILSRVKHLKSPREAWEELKASKKLKRKIKDQREQVYLATRECNIFNAAYARWIIETLKGKNAKVIDPSSGWGDRLIGAIAADVELYHGFDPNPRLQPGYSQIISELGDKVKHKITESPFEEALVEKNFYDIALTSPPYYSYENYMDDDAEGSKNQSTVRYPEFEDWVSDMYVPYLTNMFNAVKPRGYIVVSIGDVRLDDGKVYPLVNITKSVMRTLGAKPKPSLGLAVVSEKNKDLTNRELTNREISWAFVWSKPL